MSLINWITEAIFLSTTIIVFPYFLITALINTLISIFKDHQFKPSLKVNIIFRKFTLVLCIIIFMFILYYEVVLYNGSLYSLVPSFFKVGTFNSSITLGVILAFAVVKIHKNKKSVDSSNLSLVKNAGNNRFDPNPIQDHIDLDNLFINNEISEHKNHDQ